MCKPYNPLSICQGCFPPKAYSCRHKIKHDQLKAAGTLELLYKQFPVSCAGNALKDILYFHKVLKHLIIPVFQVAKDVSIRLHSQLDGGEKKRSRLEEENEELRNKLQDLEVAKQVLQQEIDKVRGFEWLTMYLDGNIQRFSLYVGCSCSFIVSRLACQVRCKSLKPTTCN